MNSLMETYKRLPVAFTRGRGSYLFDAQGEAYLDALSGIAVCGLGHAHPRVSSAIAQQSAELIHTSNLYEVPLQQHLAQRLCAISGMEAVFFGNSGAEANEAAIKLARLYGHRKGISSPRIIVMEDAFHGRTMATLTATGNRKVQAGFEPLLSGFVRAPFNQISPLERIAANDDEVVAIMVEPIQGEAGIVVPDSNYLSRLRQLCDSKDWLLILDEVQSGNGRCGEYFAYQLSDAVPDVVTTAKGLANGVPIGACLARGDAATVLGAGSHGSTFGGNPLACAAAHAVLDELEQEQLQQRARKLGERLLQGFRANLNGSNQVRDIRGVGLMLGIELHSPCGELVQAALEQKLLINVAHENTVRLLPPLTLSDAEADQIVKILSQLILEFTPATVED